MMSDPQYRKHVSQMTDRDRHRAYKRISQISIAEEKAMLWDRLHKPWKERINIDVYLCPECGRWYVSEEYIQDGLVCGDENCKGIMFPAQTVIREYKAKLNNIQEWLKHSRTISVKEGLELEKIMGIKYEPALSTNAFLITPPDNEGKRKGVKITNLRETE